MGIIFPIPNSIKGIPGYLGGGFFGVFFDLNGDKDHRMLHQLQTQKLQHKILPHHIALLNLMHLDIMSLDQRIEGEIFENPALEESPDVEDSEVDKFIQEKVQDFQNWEEYGYDDIPDYKTEYENYLPVERMPERQIAETPDFREELKRQFRFVEWDESKYKLADFIIDSLDERGFLSQDLEAISEVISFRQNVWVNPEELEPILRRIQHFDPWGCGSRNLKEFFEIQLLKKTEQSPDHAKALVLVRDHFSDLHSCNIEKIKREMRLQDGQLKEVLRLLAVLKTRPFSGSSQMNQFNHTVIPDFVIRIEGEELMVSLTKERSAFLHINQAWADSVSHLGKDKTVDHSTRQYMRSKLASAQWFIKAIYERETTMLKVIRAIVRFQYDYFMFGDTMQLKPMVLKNIAEIVGLDISTVSRITCNKYADTPFGLILLKDLFTEGLSNKDGGIISNKVIQQVVEEVVEKEDKKRPYTDQQLTDILTHRGYVVARRTVAKYRDQLNIPIAQMRALFC